MRLGKPQGILPVGEIVPQLRSASTAVLTGMLSLAQFVFKTCGCGEAEEHLRLSCMSWPRGGPGSLGLHERGVTHSPGRARLNAWCLRVVTSSCSALQNYLLSSIFFLSYSILLCNFEKCVSLQKLISALINSTGHLISSRGKTDSTKHVVTCEFHLSELIPQEKIIAHIPVLVK